MATLDRERILPSTLNDSDLFDETAGYDDETGIRFASGLTLEERRQATALYRLFNGLWGLCLARGDPGMGKDVFGNYILWKIKRYFPFKRIVRDEKPRKLFGKYDALFSDRTIIGDIRRMMVIAKGRSGNHTGDDDGTPDPDTGLTRVDRVANDWVKGAGTVLLKNSATYLTEFHQYCNSREPHNPMNRTMGSIFKVKRHLDTIIFGTTQQIEDLDRFTCKPWVDWVVTCTRSTVNKTGFSFFVSRVKYDRRVNVLIPIGKPFPIRVDAGKPRSDMGDGRIVIKRHNYVPETEEERIVLDVLRAGIDKYEDLVDFIYEHGDMDEWEILETLKNLSFNPRKHVIDYPCVFRLYNSKSAPQLKTSLKIAE